MGHHVELEDSDTDDSDPVSNVCLFISQFLTKSLESRGKYKKV